MIVIYRCGFTNVLVPQTQHFICSTCTITIKYQVTKLKALLKWDISQLFFSLSVYPREEYSPEYISSASAVMMLTFLNKERTLFKADTFNNKKQFSYYA